MKKTVDRIRGAGSPLARLVQKDQFVGWVYSVDYERALVLTNDLFKHRASGIPHNCFLVAAAFDPDRMSEAEPEELEVVLLRVVGTADLPKTPDDVRTKIDHLMRQESPEAGAEYDELTLSQLQFSGLDCRVLGTFYMADGELNLGSDIESFYAAAHLRVYRPVGAALDEIVNHVDPIRQRDLEEAAKDLGLSQPIDPFPIGTVRYTSTDRLHREDESAYVSVKIQPVDFLARRTAVFGMTRTGKSNTIKQLVSVVKRVSDDSGVTIGQIIYDVNGEYANPNQQDEGALSEVYPEENVIRYRMVDTTGFRPLQNNFYIQLTEGHAILTRVIQEGGGTKAGDIENFLEAALQEPPEAAIGDHKRWEVRAAAYQALLHRAGFEAPDGFTVSFDANKGVREAVKDASGGEITKHPNSGLTLDEAVAWFEAARRADLNHGLTSSSGKSWLDPETQAMLNMLAGQNKNGTYIKGWRELIPGKKYHSSRRSNEVGSEIYDHLTSGKIVILDLSVGDPRIREQVSEDIARFIFQSSLSTFVDGQRPPDVVIYIEEAHNLIGRNAELHETWPRIAKEGAKYRLGLVYATQEPSSMHPNILANTENWVVTHLNNERELRELTRFYDFSDFERSLMRAQDVGFARVKTLSGPFVVPVQIDKFNPEHERERAAMAAEGRTGTEVAATGDGTRSEGV